MSPTGPGKYDAECEAARESTGALATLLIIIGGTRGSGFSMTTVEHAQQPIAGGIPALLRRIADQIEDDLTPKGSA